MTRTDRQYGINQIVPDGLPSYRPLGERPRPPIKPPTPPRDPRTPTPSPKGPTKLPPGPPPTPKKGSAFLPKLPVPPIAIVAKRRVFAIWPWMLREGDRIVEFHETKRQVKAIYNVTRVERPEPGRGCPQRNIHINGACYSRHLPLFYIPRKETDGENDGSEESAA